MGRYDHSINNRRITMTVITPADNTQPTIIVPPAKPQETKPHDGWHNIPFGD